MIVIGAIIAGLGAIALFVAYIMLIIFAFRTSGSGWGIVSIILPIVGLIHGIIHWGEGGSRPVIIYLVGLVVLFIGYGLIFAGAGTVTTTTTTSLLF
jgi:hypothetical protein